MGRKGNVAETWSESKDAATKDGKRDEEGRSSGGVLTYLARS